MAAYKSPPERTAPVCPVKLRRVLFFLVFALIAHCPVDAGAAQQLRQLAVDFRPVIAMAMKSGEEQFVLDRGSRSSVRPGDLFALVDKGMPIYVPGTKRVLGYQDKVVGKCRVTRVTPASSACTVYSSSRKLPPRLEAMRFTGMRAALFIDGRLVSPVFSSYSLRKLLPNLDWVEPSSGPVPVPTKSSMEAFGIDLMFDLQDDSLHVYGPDMEEFSVYKVPSAGESVMEKAEKRPSLIETRVAPAPFSFDFSRAKVVGTLNGKVLQVAVADLDGDGQEEIVYLMENEVGVAPYRRRGRAEFYRFGDFECPCGLSFSRGWIVINVAIKGAGLTSKLFSYRAGRLHLVQDEINLWLSFARTRCGQAGPELMGQEYEKERFRGQRVFSLKPTDSGIEYLEQQEFPNDFSIASTDAQSVNGTCTLFYVSFDGFFKVYANGSHQWTSLFPVVADRPCCGPAKADFLILGRGILFNGVIPEEKGKGLNGLFYFPLSGGYEFFRADSGLRGTLCGVSMTREGIIIGVTDKTKGGWKTRLYQFPIS